MASPSLRYRSTRALPRTPITRLHLLLLAGVSAAALLWGWVLITGQQVGDIVRYLLLLGLYGVASAVFIFTRTKENHLRFFDIPVFLTILMFVEFGLAPLECFVGPAQLNYNFHGNYAPLLEALPYVIAGMVAFGAGCKTAEGRTRHRETEAALTQRRKYGRTQFRILQATVAIYAVSFAVKVYLLTHHLYSYLASGSLYFQNLASMQVLNVVAGFATYGLIIACIERYLHPSDQKWKLLFAAIFASECFWGLVSGMKGLLIQNFVIVALVSSLIQRRFRKGWVIAAVLGAIALYPVSNQYRNLVRSYGTQGAGFTSAVEAGREAVRHTSAADSGAMSLVESGWRSAVARLDLLQSVGLIMSLGPSAAFVQDNARWWMLPFYPFIPRFIWHSKPVLNEGGKFSVALGYGTMSTVGTSTAVTYPGDLYLSHGLPGVVAGMFLLGLVGQWLTNSVSGAADRRRLFIYAAIFLSVTDMEIDAFSFWSGLLKTFVILSVITWFVYGPRRRPPRGRACTRRALARP